MTAAEGRRFGVTLGLAFVVLAAVLWWRAHQLPAAACTAVAATLVMAGLTIPQRLDPVYRAWMGFALVLSRITTPVLMGVIFYFVIVPIGLVMRLAGRNPLLRTPTGDSYWITRTSRQSDLRRQF